MSPNLKFLAELRRRQVLRACAIYAGIAWLVVGIGDIAFPLLDAPAWLLPALVWGALVGLVITAIMAWFLKLGDRGLELDDDGTAPAPVGPLRNVALVAVLLAALAVSLYVNIAGSERFVAEHATIAVLPFRDLSSGGEYAYLAEGIAEEVLNALVRVDNLSVISRNSSFKFADSAAGAKEISRQLNVQNVLEGSVRTSGDVVRVSVQLVDTVSDVNRWSLTYERKLTNIFSLQDEIAAEVAREFRLTKTGHRSAAQTVDPQAYQLLLRARHQTRRFTPEALARSNALLRRALDLEPNYLMAMIDLATNHTLQAGEQYADPVAAIAQARSLLEQAIASDPQQASALANMAWLNMRFENDIESAARYMKRAVQLDNLSSEVLRVASAVLFRLGRTNQAMPITRRLIRQDPLQPFHHANLGVYTLFAGEYERSVSAYRTALELSPGFIGAHYAVGLAHLFMQDVDTALIEIAKEPDEEFRTKGLAMAYFRAGRTEEHEAALTALIDGWGDVWPSEVAEVLAFTGKVNAAFAWIEKDLAASNGAGWAESVQNPVFNSLRADPRWRSVLERTGLQPERLARIDLPVPGGLLMASTE